ncbi:lipopolysaccharide biosynthesis protein [Bergeyella porcorum]|uniref:lipopolysaccharide biosynthesis protein n=1 Tax=Bergeyella porcorum TaxID=1735111 RepID=UPI002E208E5B
MKKLLGETIIYGIGAILPRVITFLLNPFYIHFISAESFAVFTNLYAWIAYINIILTFGFETSFFRFSADENEREKTFNTSFWFVFGVAATFLLMVVLFNNPIAILMQYGNHPEFILWLAIIAFLDAICMIPFAWLRFHNKPIIYSAIRVSSILVQTLVVLVLFLFIPKDTALKLGLKDQVAYPFISNLLGSLAALLMLLPIILKVKFQFSKPLFIKMLKYSWPIMIAGFAFQINENWDKLVQIYTIPQVDAGAYGGCYKLAVLMTLFVTAYRMGIEPFFFKQMNNENAKQTYAKVTEYFTLFASVAALGIIANLEWLKRLFITDSSFWIAIDIVPIIVIANLFFGIYYNLSTWYKVTDKTYYGLIISWIGAALTIVLHFLFLEKYGFMVSAWVTFVAYFIMMILSYFLGQQHYPIPYKVKKISIFLILLMAFSYISVEVLDSHIVWSNVLLTIYISFIFYSERELIKNTFMKKRAKN